MEPALLAAGVVLLASPTWFWPGDMSVFPIVSLAFTVLVAALIARWHEPATRPFTASLTWSVLAGAASAVLLGTAAHRLVTAVLLNPADPARGDMLTVIELAGRKFLRGGDPYGTYHLPWEVHLPYGPPLWVPFLLPQVLRIDLRLLTVCGQLVVPCWCAASTIAEAARGRLASSTSWLVLLAVLAFNPDLLRFALVGHTPVYWPLLPLAAFLIVLQRWRLAGAVLGVLVAARTSMVSIVPVFLITVWYRDRSQTLSSALVCALAAAGILLPFFVWDPSAMWSGMVTNYVRGLKEVVWTSGDGGAVKTIGLTGWLLSHHLERFVEVSQALSLALVDGASWLAIKRGASGLAYMGLALFAFTMTTVWPVYYTHFDVILFWISSAIAEHSAPLLRNRLWSAWAASLAGAATLVAGMVLVGASTHPTVLVAGPGSVDLLRFGFSNREDDGARRYRWATGTRAAVLLPRRSASATDVVITGLPFVPPGSIAQAATAILNGVPLGTVHVNGGWQTLRFHAPAPLWRIGANELELQFPAARSPKELGLSDDPRHLALAIERVDIQEP